MRTTMKRLISGVGLLALFGGGLQAEPAGRDARIAELERKLAELAGELEALRSRPAAPAPAEERISAVETRLSELEEKRLPDLEDRLPDFDFGGLSLGGYGEMHANFTDGEGGDSFDIHRLVLYLGYEFNDWISFHSEAELEHAITRNGDEGEYLALEQAYIEFLLSESYSIRLGRVLVPVGITNAKHEPPTFNGVERPSFDKYIVPTTWFGDGIGIVGSPSPWFSYEAYVMGGLDGSGFSAKEGIRGGRIKERPSLNDPAVTARVDFYPLAHSEPSHGQSLRLGLSGYFGGINNGNKGKDPGLDGDIRMLSADFEYTIGRFDFRGAVAHTDLSDASGLPDGVAEEMFGWYLEGAYRFWPDAWRTGRLANSDAVVFVRYDDYDTQYGMPDGVAANEAYDRSEWTVGLGFYPIPDLVLKADYQFRDSAGGDDPENALNLGVGFQF